MVRLSLQTWALIGVACVAAVVVGASRWQVAQAEEKLATCGSDLREARFAIEKQNARVETWQQAASTAAQASREAASATAAEFADRVAPELRRLRAAKAATCADAVRQVREGLG